MMQIHQRLDLATINCESIFNLLFITVFLTQIPLDFVEYLEEVLFLHEQRWFWKFDSLVEVHSLA